MNEGNICLSEWLYFDFNEERKNVDLLELNLHQLKNYSKATQNLEKFEIIKISKIRKNFCSKILNNNFLTAVIYEIRSDQSIFVQFLIYLFTIYFSFICNLLINVFL